MEQKLDKALRLMDEVLTSIAVRNNLHPLWDEVIQATAEATKSTRKALNALDDVVSHVVKILLRGSNPWLLRHGPR